MSTMVTVGSWVAINKGCPIDYQVLASTQAEFTCGSRTDGFEFVMDVEALREFLAVGGKALAEMDELLATELHEAAEPHRTTGHQPSAGVE